MKRTSGLSSTELLVASAIICGLLLFFLDSLNSNYRHIQRLVGRNDSFSDYARLVKDIIVTTRGANDCALGSSADLRWLECTGVYGAVLSRVRFVWSTDPASQIGIRKEQFSGSVWNQLSSVRGRVSLQVCDSLTAATCPIVGARFNSLVTSNRLFRFRLQYESFGRTESIQWAVGRKNPTGVPQLAYTSNTLAEN
jgi:hypothetical protein